MAYKIAKDAYFMPHSKKERKKRKKKLSAYTKELPIYYNGVLYKSQREVKDAILSDYLDIEHNYVGPET
jgi:hypothetical protein